MNETKHRVLRWLVPLGVVVVGAGLAIALIETSPAARRQAPERQARLVEVMAITVGPQRALVHAMGTVQAAREVTVQPRVSGQIVAVSDEFVPGGRFHEGDLLVQIDPTDFALAVRQRESGVALAQSDLALELGHQTIAQREFDMLGDTITEDDRALVLRQPQLDKVRAALQTAEAALAQAKLNLDRASVRAPFNAVVRAREVNLGMQVSPATTLATLVGTDEYWIEVTVPVDQLQWVEVPGSTVRVFQETAWGAERFRSGRVIRRLSDLEQEGRLARLLVSVVDPLALQPDQAGQPQLLLGDYVRVEIAGVELPAVAAVDREFVHDGHQVWLMNEKEELEIRPVTIAFRGRDRIFIRDGVRAGERLVTSGLAAPVPGMPLRTASGPAPAARP